MHPSDLSPKALEIITMYGEMRRPNAMPRLCYQALPDSERLSYELLNWDNYLIINDLFSNDLSPFIASDFREKSRLDLYAAFQLASGRYSGKHGSCDWFLRLKDGTYIGVLHLYDVSFELMDGKRFPSSCGYAIAAPFRRQGYALEALQHLLFYLPPHFKIYEVQAEPLRTNEASIALLTKAGFTHKKYFKNEWGNAVLMYKKLVDNIPKLTWQEIDA